MCVPNNKKKNSDPVLPARAKISSSAVGFAAILCLIHSPKTAAQPATTEGQPPAETQGTPSQTPAEGAPKQKSNQAEGGELPPIQVRAPRATRRAPPTQVVVPQ